MPNERFDLARLRERWSVEHRPAQAGGVHPKLALVEPPRETLEQARARFSEVRRDIERELPERRALFAPFFREVEELFDRLLALGEESVTSWAELDAALAQIDELLAVFVFPPRR